MAPPRGHPSNVPALTKAKIFIAQLWTASPRVNPPRAPAARHHVLTCAKREQDVAMLQASQVLHIFCTKTDWDMGSKIQIYLILSRIWLSFNIAVSIFCKILSSLSEILRIINGEYVMWTLCGWWQKLQKLSPATAAATYLLSTIHWSTGN